MNGRRRGRRSKPADPTGVAMFIRGVPRTLRDHFHAWCTLRGICMKDKLISLMRETIKETDLGRK